MIRGHEYSYIFTNLLVVGLFLFTNPFIALLLCAIISSLNLRINFFIFTASFVISWTIFHYMRDFEESAGDIIPYLEIYQNAIDDSIFTVIDRFVSTPLQNEPLWNYINKIIGFFIGYNPAIYIFIIYFVIFLLVSILAYNVSKQNFAIIIFFIFFINLGLLYNIFHVWRHTISILIFIIGIYINEKPNKQILSRFIIYIAPLIHLVALPLIFLYELFSFLDKSNKITRKSEIFNNTVIIYCILYILLLFIYELLFDIIVDSFNLYQFRNIYTEWADFRPFWLISPLSLMLIYTLYIKRYSLSKNEIYLGITYYLLVCTPLIVQTFPGIVYGRTLYLFLLGASIIVAQTMITRFKHLTLLIIVIGSYRFYTFLHDNVVHTLTYLGGGTPLNPYSGIISMIYHQEYFNMIDM